MERGRGGPHRRAARRTRPRARTGRRHYSTLSTGHRQAPTQQVDAHAGRDGQARDRAPGTASCSSSPSSPTPLAGWPSVFTDAGYTHRHRLRAPSTTERATSCRNGSSPATFQVLVSTDAGGEGIDLQSAHVMVDWDLPWSPGAPRAAHGPTAPHRPDEARPRLPPGRPSIPAKAASKRSCSPTSRPRARRSAAKLYDLLDATAARAGFDWGKAMIDAQGRPGVTIPGPRPSSEPLAPLVNEERSLSDPSQRRTRHGALRRRPARGHQPCHRRCHGRPDRPERRLGHSGRAPRPASASSPRRRPRLARCPRRGTSRARRRRRQSVRASRQRRRAQDSTRSIVLGPTEEAVPKNSSTSPCTGEADLVRGAPSSTRHPYRRTSLPSSTPTYSCTTGPPTVDPQGAAAHPVSAGRAFRSPGSP